MHYPLPPSSAHRWGECEGSVLMEAQHPDQETEEAAEGTASHWVGEQSLRTMVAPDQDWRMPYEFVGEKAPNGLIITKAMAEGADLYVTSVAKVCNDHGMKQQLMFEQRLPAPMIHALCGGTSDAGLYVPDLHRLYIWDYKFGHVVVEADDNKQGICYYAGFYDHLGLNGLSDQQLDVRIIVVQPRAYHRYGPVREWRTTGGELRGRINRLVHKAELAFREDAQCHSGPWCLHCKAAYDCETLGKRAQAAMSFSGARQRSDMRPEDIAFELTMLRAAKHAIKERLTGIEQHAESLMDNGAILPGWTRERAKGRTRWAVPTNQVIALGKMFGKDLAKLDTVTPKQAQSLGIDGAVISGYIETPTGSAKLVESTETIAYQAFNKR